jgi:hypothetical protein
MPLLDNAKPVFIQPTYGIPDNTDGADWISFREYFGLPSGETQTLQNSIPQEVIFNDDTVLWGGIELHLTPLMERIIVSQVDTGLVDIALSGEVASEEIALLFQRGNKFLINSNLVHLHAYYILSGLLGGPMNTPALADVTIADDKALIFAEHDTDIDIDLNWNGTAHQFRYNAIGELITDGDIEIDSNFYAELTQGELVILIRGDNFLCGDANSDEDVNVGDAVFIINYVFNSGPAPDPLEAGDANCDGQANVGDAVYLINYVFKGGPEPCCP